MKLKELNGSLKKETNNKNSLGKTFLLIMIKESCGIDYGQKESSTNNFKKLFLVSHMYSYVRGVHSTKCKVSDLDDAFLN